VREVRCVLVAMLLVFDAGTAPAERRRNAGRRRFARDLCAVRDMPEPVL
jgi:hypothetical protein